MTENNQFDRTNDVNDFDRYYGTVIDSEGQKVGDVGQVYLDDATGRPEWVTVKTGLFGMKETFVPLRGEQIANGEIRVPYTKDQIKGAPSIDPEGHITEAEEQELYRYYSIEQEAVAGYDADRRTEQVVDRDVTAGGVANLDAARADRVGREDNLADGDVVRHEERLNVGKEQVESGRVRIRKHVVNEQQSVQVPVSHEELRVERTPIKDGDVVSDGQLAEGETEVVLHEERPVVSKETVGVEKVSVGTEKVTENRTVTENVAKEQIQVEGDGVRTDRDEQFRDPSLKDKIENKVDDLRDKH
ncbi:MULTISPECIES: PRC and DUF2382 domain-containing protein [unclassified Luteococcus]|uniref:PRC and DUF2382 domain-containing protein n=1 Tax=unclassified Luteococcus TaxID=2639923 RepID=UPI00313E0F14